MNASNIRPTSDIVHSLCHVKAFTHRRWTKRSWNIRWILPPLATPRRRRSARVLGPSADRSTELFRTGSWTRRRCRRPPSRSEWNAEPDSPPSTRLLQRRPHSTYSRTNFDMCKMTKTMERGSWESRGYRLPTNRGPPPNRSSFIHRRYAGS